MAIPSFQDLMLPILQITSDKRDYHIREVIDTLAQGYHLSDDELREMLPSGKQTTFDNRAHWARTYLVKTRLLESTGRGRIRITDRGLDVLSQNPSRVDLKFLSMFPELQAFREGSKSFEMADQAETSQTQTPEESLEVQFTRLKNELAAALLDRIKANSPKFFEDLVIDLLIALGYGGSRKDAGQSLGRSGDGGIDGMIKEDRLGLSNIYVQAKRWEGTVGRPVVQSFAGALDMVRANRGIFITTSTFSSDARDYVERIGKRIVLIDGRTLVDLMIEHDVGVAVKQAYIVKEIDENYFVE